MKNYTDRGGAQVQSSAFGVLRCVRGTPHQTAGKGARATFLVHDVMVFTE